MYIGRAKRAPLGACSLVPFSCFGQPAGRSQGSALGKALHWAFPGGRGTAPSTKHSDVPQEGTIDNSHRDTQRTKGTKKPPSIFHLPSVSRFCD